MKKDVAVLLVGCGRMGGVLLEGWRARGLAVSQLWVVEPDAVVRRHLRITHAVASAIDLPAAGLQPEVIVLAVKPQDMETVVDGYRRFADGGAVFLSIAAGKSIAYFENSLGTTAAIVRAMPNMPAAVQRGVTVACGNVNVDEAGRALCTSLLETVGTVIWVEKEELLDAVTAVSGSGPAYVFLLVEALAQAGHAAGLPADLAERLARLTVAGAGELLYRSPESAATLRRNVTSPRGTTAAALAVLMDTRNGLDSLLTHAVAAAVVRSRELAF